MAVEFQTLSCDRIVNLTPHEVELHDELNNGILVLKPSTFEISISSVTSSDGRIYVPITLLLTKTYVGRVNNLPDPVEGTIYIVEDLVARLCPDRPDLYVVGMPELRSGLVRSISTLAPLPGPVSPSLQDQ